jgi:hypothetical protein
LRHDQEVDVQFRWFFLEDRPFIQVLLNPGWPLAPKSSSDKNG